MPIIAAHLTDHSEFLKRHTDHLTSVGAGKLSAGELIVEVAAKVQCKGLNPSPTALWASAFALLAI